MVGCAQHHLAEPRGSSPLAALGHSSGPSCCRPPAILPPPSRCPPAPHAPCHVQAVPGPARSSFHISYMMQWPNPSCTCVPGLSEGTWGFGCGPAPSPWPWWVRGLCPTAAGGGSACGQATAPRAASRTPRHGTLARKPIHSRCVRCHKHHGTSPRGGSLPVPSHQLTPARTAASKASSSWLIWPLFVATKPSCGLANALKGKPWGNPGGTPQKK